MEASADSLFLETAISNVDNLDRILSSETSPTRISFGSMGFLVPSFSWIRTFIVEPPLVYSASRTPCQNRLRDSHRDWSRTARCRFGSRKRIQSKAYRQHSTAK